MTARDPKAELPAHSAVDPVSGAEPAVGVVPDSLKARLAALDREDLLALVTRLASDSDEVLSRIDYLTDARAAVESIQRRIRTFHKSTRFVAYGDTRDTAASIGLILEDIREDMLRRDPSAALRLAKKLVTLDRPIFDRADDSGGIIADQLRDACTLWLDCAAAVRASEAGGKTSWPVILYDLFRDNNYGIRERLLEQADRLLTEAELRGLAAQFEAEAKDLLAASVEGRAKHYETFGASAAMGLLAMALRDPKLYERSILIHSPRPNALQAANIAERYIECRDGPGALRWLNAMEDDPRVRRLDLMDRAYGLLGDRGRQIEIRTVIFKSAPSVHTYQALQEVLESDQHPRAAG